ncbi:MAG: Adaptive-response sensory-kinase SasA [bacterium]|nr:Adaptive-response sensory-kinase SasA [bacterium]MCK6561262.1 PAS domain S-box protein [bacterium]NUM65884.1 PAS domain S-box protein [candidate division KSB1 bacterium]
MRVISKDKSSLERRFNLFLNAFQYSTDAIILTDLQGNIIEANQAFTNLFGWTREEAVGQNTRILRAPATGDDFYRHMWQSVMARGSWVGEIVNRHKDGHEIPVLLSITPIFQDGEKIGYMGVEIDLTERKQIETQLQREREFSGSVIETANCLIVCLNLAGEITLFNRKSEEVTGYSRYEVLGKNWFEIFLLEHLRPDVSEVFEAVVRGELPSQYENYIMTRRGDERLISWSNTVIRDERHAVSGVLAIGIDITDQKRLEKQVLQTERLATIGKMAAKVAHEIRNPLSSISLNAEMLQDEISGYESMDVEEARALLRAIISEIDRMTALTEEYLQFSRLPESRLARGNLVRMIEETVEFLRHELRQKRVEVELHLQEEVGEVQFDRVQMRRALLNLIRNAAEAMPRGGKLRMRVEQRGESVIIHIEDTGIGIPQEVIGKIFEPFFTTKEVGTGLGLAIVQQIINDHGGQILCTSKVGHGTSFSIILPLDETE